ncbi:MAG TPA: hypothetical protein VJH23_01990 [archaeon]|nr:hypothetical protein [archaeon]
MKLTLSKMTKRSKQAGKNTGSRVTYTLRLGLGITRRTSRRLLRWLTGYL